MKFDLIIYDFDGTLYDTEPGLRAIMKQMLEHFGYNLENYSLRSFIGPPMEWSLANIVGVPEEKVAEMIAYFRPNYQASALEHLVFFDGILPMLYDLDKKGIQQSIASLKFKPLLEKIIAKAKLEELFVSVEGHHPESPRDKAALIRHVLSEVPAKNPIMIGDRYFDLDGAQEVGIPFLGVGYGYAQLDGELDSSDYWFATVAELHEFLQKHT